MYFTNWIFFSRGNSLNSVKNLITCSSMWHVSLSLNTKETFQICQPGENFCYTCTVSLPAPYKSFLTLHKRQKSSTIFWLNLLVFLPTLEISIKFQNKCLPFTNWHVFTTFVWGCSIDKSKPVKIKHRLVLIWIKLIIQYSLTTYISIYCITFTVNSVLNIRNKTKISMYLRSAVGCSHL